MFRKALHVIAQSWKQPSCSSMSGVTHCRTSIHDYSQNRKEQTTDRYNLDGFKGTMLSGGRGGGSVSKDHILQDFIYLSWTKSERQKTFHGYQSLGVISGGGAEMSPKWSADGDLCGDTTVLHLECGGGYTNIST